MDEAARQRELDTYRVVDSLPEEAYEDIVQLASMICRAPTALVSFVDRERQWFKARKGLDAPGTKRSEAFCDHALRNPGKLMEVTDATADPRFVDNPLVTGDLHVRFYAGMPLVTPNGAAIGTVCVLDRVPRALDETQREALAALARVTMNLLQSRHRERELERQLWLATPPADVPPAPAAPPVDMSHCTVAIFEVQNAAGEATRLGERAFERAVQRLDDLMHGVLRTGSGDSVSRISGSAEMIAVLHGTEPETADALQAMRDVMQTFEGETGLHVLAADAHSASANERLEAVYLRADEALSRAKDIIGRARG